MTDTLTATYWYCWVEPLHRPKMTCEKGDLYKAVAWYKKNIGKAPTACQFHPKCAFLADEVPAGMSHKLNAGVSMWQIQLTDTVGVEA